MATTHPIPAGFEPTQYALPVPFAEGIGPTYQRLVENGIDIGAWVTQDRRNGGKMAHGGFLMTLGDIASGRAAIEAMGADRFTVHVSFTMNFYGAASLGSWVEVHARIQRQGKSMLFCNCDYFADGEKIGNASTVMKSSELRRPAKKA